jgi:type IV secretion system protein VirB4
MLRQAIQKYINTDKIAFWISTVRDVNDLSDHVKYDIPFCKDVNDAWQAKNDWNNHFVNTLYISFVYQQADLSIKSFSGFINSLSNRTVFEFHDSYLTHALSALSQIVDNILNELKIFKARKLSIINKGDERYSELQNFLSRLIYFDKRQIVINEVDISKSLSPFSYAVGGNKIEINNQDNTKFISVLGIKEYQEMPVDV